MTGTLYLVATPIGNLETSRSAPCAAPRPPIACKTAAYARLLDHYGIVSRGELSRTQ
jgi:16S rRNA C1402 (ribose-2'-O) methylase RsmI